MYMDMGERIARKQDRPSLNIEDPLRAPYIAQNILFFLHLAHTWKTGFQIVSPCCTYVSIVMRAAFDDISVPGFYVRAQHDPEKKHYYLFIFLF